MTASHSAFDVEAGEYLELRATAAAAEAAIRKLKPGLTATIHELGDVDPDMLHETLEFAEPIRGYSALRNEHRESASVDQDAAARICAEHHLVAQCSDTLIHFAKPDRVIAFLRRTIEGAKLLQESGQMMVVYDRDRIGRLAAAGKFTAEELEEMIPVRVTWALVPVKAPAS